MDSQTLRWELPWAAVPTIRRRLLLQDAAAITPSMALLLAMSFLSSGRTPGPFAWIMAGLLIPLVQRGAHSLGTLIILPSNRGTLAIIKWIASLKWLHGRWPDVAEGLDSTIAALERMAAERERAAAQLLRSSPRGATRLQLVTPDGVHLDAMLFNAPGIRALAVASGCAAASVDAALGTATAPSSPPVRGVLVYAGGNGEHYEFRSDLVAMAAQHNFGLLLFNYRGVGVSGQASARVTRNGCVTDCITALSYLTQGCGVPANRLLIVGHSIGGAFTTEAVALLHTSGSPDCSMAGCVLVNDRSFARLSRTAQWHLAEPLCRPPHEHGLLGIAVRYIVHVLIKYIAVWELDAASWWQQIGPAAVGPAGQALNASPEQAAADAAAAKQRCYKIVAYSPHDDIIPPAAQLLEGLHHNATPHSHIGSVLHMPCPNGERGEAHNRGFNPAEESALFAAAERAFAGAALPALL